MVTEHTEISESDEIQDAVEGVLDSVVEEPIQIIGPDFHAFKPIAMTAYDMEMWTINEQLIKWDTLFALGFTSYKSYVDYGKQHVNGLDGIREVLIRLYMVEKKLSHHFVAPSVGRLIEFVFALDPQAAETVALRKKCAAYLAVLFGRDRASGYRWIRGDNQSLNLVSMELRKLCGKVFSMDPEHARSYFWYAMMATAKARGTKTETVEALLRERGIKYE